MPAILVIKHGAFGDVVMALGAFRAIREHHRGDRLIVLTTTPFASLLLSSGLFDDVWEEVPKMLEDQRAALLDQIKRSGDIEDSGGAFPL